VPIRKRLRARAFQYLRMRDSISDPTTQKALEELAGELERRADELDKQLHKPQKVNQPQRVKAPDRVPC
jgi:hypothetical protein